MQAPQRRNDAQQMFQLAPKDNPLGSRHAYQGSEGSPAHATVDPVIGAQIPFGLSLTRHARLAEIR